MWGGMCFQLTLQRLSPKGYGFFFPQHEIGAQSPQSKLAWWGIVMLLLSLVVLQ